jgi:hypothetical protein
MSTSQTTPYLHVVDAEETGSRVNSTTQEAHFISALLATGNYSPATYGIRDHQVAAFKQVHEFCKRYQAQAGYAPAVHLVTSKYPSFKYTPDCNPSWAASELYQQWKTRVMHMALAQAGIALADDNVDRALAELRATLSSLHPLLGRGSQVTDMAFLTDSDNVERCPIELPGSGMGGGAGQLQQLTGGIAPGDLWYIAARMGVGKSWRLLQMAVAAAEHGWPVMFYSLEMPVRTVMDRMHRIALRDSYKGHWDDLDMSTRSDLVSQWAAKSAPVTIYDPSRGRCDATVVAAAADSKALVVIDYVGLMHTTTGQRSMEDWRAAAIISNELKAAALEHGVPVISAAQVNRSGDSAAEPSTVHLAQSDALGQDADLVLTLKPLSRRVLTNYVAKNRNGEAGVRWFTRFEPALGRFADITADVAHDIKAEDDERHAAQTE